jgi:hypothetical protein
MARRPARLRLARARPPRQLADPRRAHRQRRAQRLYQPQLCSDAQGRWFFQNGPQRVFVSLQAAPFVYSLHGAGGVLAATAHTGIEARRIDAAFVDEEGAMYLVTDLGPGLVLDRDLARLLAAVVGPGDGDENVASLLRGDDQAIRVETGAAAVPLTRIASQELAGLFHFDPDPQPGC